MGAPFSDIGINPPRSNRVRNKGGVATVVGITYGMVVISDTGTTNFRDCKLPAGAGGQGVYGVVQDQGDPNNGGAFAIGDEFGVCDDGYSEVLLDAGQTATKGQPFITGATPGTVKPIGGEAAPYDIVGFFEQTLTAGASPTLVSGRLNIHRRQA